MLKCWDCENQEQISKATITPGGKQLYVITCKKEEICFEADYDEHVSNLPCWRDKNG